ncbi:hypothetical protein Y032_0045g1280 [Ancylostoma ceylanicum]|uniref:Uncharacterized protein n=1 Tax=Ancylostoma ceylanicum TaxID=53326 RepID=A0A016UDY7_9BILA|nr:hypothetical protein Y032_0045g1280 [Ancylostoma ceylanicum]
MQRQQITKNNRFRQNPSGEKDGHIDLLLSVLMQRFAQLNHPFCTQPDCELEKVVFLILMDSFAFKKVLSTLGTFNIC